jgi:S1-C subfamily serine protease
VRRVRRDVGVLIGVAAFLVTSGCSKGRTSSVARSPASVAATMTTDVPTSTTTSTTQPPSWAGTYGEVSSGVVRLDVTGCATAATGTGFLVSPTMIATVAHVVDGAQAVRVTVPALSLAVAGTVIGFDWQHDFALVQTASPVAGHVFNLQTIQPAIGTEIGTIGFPLAKSMALTIGHITAQHDRRQPLGLPSPISDMLVSDAALNPGNSGGPWLTLDGGVVALDESGPPFVDATGSRAQGTNGGVPASAAASLIAQWQQSPQPPAPVACPDQSGNDPAIRSALTTLNQYLWDIDATDYASAYAQLDHPDHPASGLSSFTNAVETSFDQAADSTAAQPALFDIDKVARNADLVVADVRFRSTQDAAHGPSGEVCTDWRLRYRFIERNGLWLISSVVAQPGIAENAACPPGTAGTTTVTTSTVTTTIPGT